MSGIITAAGITAAGAIGGGLLSKMGSGGAQQTQTSQSQLPGWITEQSMQNYGDLTKASYDMPGPYQGQRVADLSPETQQLIQQLFGNVGSTNAAFGDASNATRGLMQFMPQNVSPMSLSGTNLQPYMDPYIKSVIDPSMQLLDQQRQKGLNQIGDQANQTHAFGGSRQGVAEGATNAQTNMLAGQLGGQLYGTAFNNAQAAATGDITRDMQGQLANQSAGLQGASLRGQMAGQLGNLATAGQTNWLQGVQAALGGQGALQDQNQRQLQAAQDLYNEQKMDPIQRIQLRMQGIAQSPYGQTQTQTGPGPSTSPLMAGLGTASTLAGLMGKFGMFNPSPTMTNGLNTQQALQYGGGLVPSYPNPGGYPTS